ncbi:prepilin peptidase [Candidatus Saccharibacteria bacterium]|nr:prepilin peptidase [Candidatus Saccharibacteria bacterium]
MTIALLLYVIIGFLGAAMGSFAGAQVWRLRARQLVQDKQAGEPYDKAEYKRLVGLTKSTIATDRSRCLSCSHTLAWYDLLPIVSWISTKGACRYCHKPIGRFELAMEVGTALAFVVFTFTWLSAMGTGALSICILVLWLVALTMFVILFAYDLKWFLLPDIIMFPLIGLSIVITALSVYGLQGGEILPSVLSVIASIGILAGLYFMLWYVSKGMWVGFGDVKLGIALGILLIDWKLALLTLFLANLLGTLVVLPGLLTGKLSRKTQVPFGPFLIVGFFISVLWGTVILNSYNDFSQWLTTFMLML